MLPLPEPPKHLCLIRLSAIGDTCHTVPVVRALQARWPSTRLTWVIGKTEHGLMRGLDGVDFMVLDKAAGWRGYAAVRRALHGKSFDALLHMHASTRANLVSLFVRAPLRLGFDRARARDSQWLFTNARLAPQPRRHVMDGLLEFAEHIGAPRGPLRWDIPLADEDRAFAATVLSTAAPTLVISPCTGQRLRNFRNWSIESYAAVADYAHARYGAHVVLTGGGTAVEQRYGEGIVARSAAAPLNLIGRTTLKQLLAVLERASVLLCPDSGPAHMATAVRTPVVGLYATSNRFRTGPYFSQNLVVDKYPEAVAREFGRPVESLRWGQRVRDPDAMNLIGVADVTAKLDVAFAERAIRPVATTP
jgi:heptosyltransferase I